MRGWFAAILIAALAVAAGFLADNPGKVDILWHGYEVETSAALLVVGAVVIAILVWALLTLLRLLFRTPSTLLRAQRERRRRKGYRALTQGMVALAAGDAQEAQRHARKADLLLSEPPLTLLLSAQAAQLSGDEAAAKKFFTAMLDRPETEFLGIRGLLNQAMRAGDRAAAVTLAQRAHALRPNARWVVESLFELAVRDERWEAARDRLGNAVRLKIIDAERARHHRGVILHELSLTASRSGDAKEALKLAAEAQALAPDLASLAIRHARLLLDEGRTRTAARAIERAWRSAASPELARAYGEIFAGESPLTRIKCFERLAEEAEGSRESHIAVAQAAFEAKLWGEARRHLEAALAAPPAAALPGTAAPAFARAAAAGDQSGPTPRMCLLMARIEEVESADPARVREWLDRAMSAPPDPLYLCANCGAESLEWHPLCPHCGGFDALFWRTPSRAPGLLTGDDQLSLPAAAPAPTIPAANAGEG